MGAWGVVISTGTAFLLGVLALLGSACPPQLRVFLLALAIADDVGAPTVIALFYTEDLRLGALAVAGLGFALMFALRWLRVWRGPAYLVLAVVAWVALHPSGVHPTLLGVAVALATPAYHPRREEVEDAARRARAYLQSPDPEYAVAAQLSIARSVPASERTQRLWQPWTNTVIVPLFALANAGVPLTGETLRAAATPPVTLGVIAGLVLGELVGVLLGTGLAVRLRLGDLAPGLTRLDLAGGAALSGIGSTISLFIVDLAPSGSSTQQALADQARVGILAATVLATVLGAAVLRLDAHRAGGAGEAGDHRPARARRGDRSGRRPLLPRPRLRPVRPARAARRGVRPGQRGHQHLDLLRRRAPAHRPARRGHPHGRAARRRAGGQRPGTVRRRGREPRAGPGRAGLGPARGAAGPARGPAGDPGPRR
nr:Na+/H+ antiporter NhaA [Quadrisphaera sp. DSM 44207]